MTMLLQICLSDLLMTIQLKWHITIVIFQLHSFELYCTKSKFYLLCVQDDAPKMITEVGLQYIFIRMENDVVGIWRPVRPGGAGRSDQRCLAGLTAWPNGLTGQILGRSLFRVVFVEFLDCFIFMTSKLFFICR